MSGGRATIGRRKGDILAAQAGDITAIDPAGSVLTDRYFVECKFYKALDLEAFWEGRGKLWKFWVKAQSEAKAHNKEPILIAKQNRTPVMVLVNVESFLDLPNVTKWRSVSMRHGDVAILWLSTLLKQNPSCIYGGPCNR